VFVFTVLVGNTGTSGVCVVYVGLLEEVGGFEVGCGEVEGLEVGMRVGGMLTVEVAPVPCPEL